MCKFWASPELAMLPKIDGMPKEISFNRKNIQMFNEYYWEDVEVGQAIDKQVSPEDDYIDTIDMRNQGYSDEEIDDMRHQVDDQYGNAIQWKAIDIAEKYLNEDQLDVWYKHFVDETSLGDIAKDTERSVSTVKRLYKDATLIIHSKVRELVEAGV